MTEVIETLRVPRSGRMLKVRFLPAGETANALLYIEDTERIQAQAQQIKLAALGRLTASMAHEIRNPLAAISHAAELLSEGQTAPTLERLARIIGDNTQRLNRLVTDIVELGRRDRVQPELIKLHEAIGVLIDELALTHANLREVIDVECVESLRLRFDRGHLHRILTNLVENSLRYCKNLPGSVRVAATVEGVTDRVELTVTDDGPGVEPDVGERLFEPFFTTRSSGTGLGLYIARELCEANGAKLELAKNTRGASFRIVGQGER
jgi:two-component system sensor histidine kinase PilS (NtrC family)